MNWQDDIIAVDWGTSNRRAYVLGSDGHLKDSFEDELGLMAISQGGFDAAVAHIRARLGDKPMLLAGMVGSNKGWRDAGYVPCPAGAAQLARAIVWVDPGRTGIVSGVSQSGPAGADVMRGEEVQVVGALAAGLVPEKSLICHPGTHAKWICTGDQQILSFRTIMTGEIFALLRKHSILADQLRDEVSAAEPFMEGVRAGLAGREPLASLFAVRARYLLGERDSGGASYASGLLIGSDVRNGLELHHSGPIALIGRPDLCALYAVALAAAGHDACEVDGARAFLAGIRRLTEVL